MPKCMDEQEYEWLKEEKAKATEEALSDLIQEHADDITLMRAALDAFDEYYFPDLDEHTRLKEKHHHWNIFTDAMTAIRARFFAQNYGARLAAAREGKRMSATDTEEFEPATASPESGG